MKDFTITIPAGGAVMTQWSGTVLSVKTCTLKISAAFDGGASQDVKSGFVLKSETPFRFVNFVNPNLVPVTVYFFIGEVALNFSPDDSSVSQAKTYCIGNLGIPIGAAAAGGKPGCNSDGFLQITNNMQLQIPGSDYGHPRQQIVFTTGASGSVLNVMDINLCVFLQATMNRQVIILDTDYPFIISGGGGVALVAIGQTFLA